MTQGFKSTDCSSIGPEFNSQKHHGGSQPSIKGPNALLWRAEEHADRASTHINKKYKAIYNE